VWDECNESGEQAANRIGLRLRQWLEALTNEYLPPHPLPPR
jgi:hypothetical protein